MAQGLGEIGIRSGLRRRGAPLPPVDPDRGCRFGGPSCLACGLPVCWLDMSPKERARLLAERKLALRPVEGLVLSPTKSLK